MRIHAESRTTPSPAVEEDVVFVALGKNVKESENVLMWALRNRSGKKICILHVHQPAQKIPMMGTKVSISLMEDHQVKKYHEKERQEMYEIIDTYIQICEQAGVEAEKLCVEMDSIEKGILQLIVERGIKWLVMGAAASKSYSRKMKEPKSKKAIRVRLEAPNFCHIWFICKGSLIYTRTFFDCSFNESNLYRESKLGEVNNGVDPPQLQSSQTIESLRSRSVAEGERIQARARVSKWDYRKVRSYNLRSGSGDASSQSSLNQEGNIARDKMTRRSPSVGSHLSTSSCEIIEDMALIPHPWTEESEIEFSSSMSQHSNGQRHHSSVASSIIDENRDDELCERLEQFLVEAESCRKEAYEESIRRNKAEKEIIVAIHRAKASEAMYAEELRRRREIEAAIARDKEVVKKMKCQLDEILEELGVAQEQELSMQCQVADSDKIVEALEKKMFSAVELLKKMEKERDELKVERDNALRVAEDLREKQAEEASSSSLPQFFSEFSFLEIEEATCNFSEDLKIGVGGYGTVYKGQLRHTHVAIKMLQPNSLQGPVEFQQEVNVLGKMRHPNLVTLIGACPEAWALIYEYLPNGSLEDRLNRADSSPPLSWQTRIRIASELCSALIFLHSCRPQGIVHGDLKPANILLDANFVSKLSDFGICRLLPKQESSENTTVCCKTDPKGTFVYMDPEFTATGELTTKSDVYSFGIILLRLLTGRPALGIPREVEYALDKGNLKNLLDPTAGEWPFVQAKQLAHLAISCADMNRKRRPDLASDVWGVLESMRTSCGIQSVRFTSEARHQIPTYFYCPIFKEIIQDPLVAADGYTYEAEAIKGWLSYGHDTSPVTNLPLPHYNLVPNHALRAAIQEFLQQL